MVTLPVYATAPYAKQTVELPQELKRICSCESTGSPNGEPQQFKEDGSVLRGVINPQDIGACQINTKYWLAKAEELGFDIFTEEGNKQMALWIYNDLGNKPWFWSKSCWQ